MKPKYNRQDSRTSHLRDRYRMATTTANTSRVREAELRACRSVVQAGPHQTSPATTSILDTNPPSKDQTGLEKKCSSLTSCSFVSPGVMVGFAFIVEGMSITPRPGLWSGIDLEVEGLSWSGLVCHSIIGLSLLSLQAISTLWVTGKTSSWMWNLFSLCLSC